MTTAAPRRRRRLVGLAPGRVVVVRGSLDLARARVDAPVCGTDAAVAPPRRTAASVVPAAAAISRVGEADPLQAQPVAGDERLDVADVLERPADIR